MKRRTTNRDILREFVKDRGGYQKAADALGVSRTLFWEITKGKSRYQIKEATRAKICEHLGIDEETLFPLICCEKKEQAS